jgi:hypothetical protein
MSPIVRNGYRSDTDKSELQAFYATTAWKRARELVLTSANHGCEWCGTAPSAWTAFTSRPNARAEPSRRRRALSRETRRRLSGVSLAICGRVLGRPRGR